MIQQSRIAQSAFGHREEAAEALPSTIEGAHGQETELSSSAHLNQHDELRERELATQAAGSSPSSSELEFRNRLLTTYESYGALELYWRMYGPVPVRPLGVSSEEYFAWRNANPAGPWPVERAADLLRRISAVNRSSRTVLSSSSGNNFQAVVYAGVGDLETIVGSSLGKESLSVEDLAGVLAGEAGIRFSRLPEEKAQSLIQLADEFHYTQERLRREFYASAWEFVANKLDRGLEERDISVVHIGHSGRISIIRLGQDLHLDQLLDSRNRREREVHNEVVHLLTSD